MPLPLFPRLIAWYAQRESHAPTTLLARLLGVFQGFRQSLLSISGSSVELGHGQGQGQQGKNWDVVLLGGAMGSLFSFCQCIVSPWLGSREYDTGWSCFCGADLAGSTPHCFADIVS
jgi:hypothetical protein